MAALTFAELRHLVKLYREHVDGADMRLAEIISTHADELPDVLGFPREHLPRLHRAPDPVALLAGTIEAAGRRSKEQKNSAQKTAAAVLATRLAAAAQQDGRTVVLEVGLLAETVAAWPGSGSIVFGSLGSADVARVRALLRECRRVRCISAVLAGERIVISYETASSAGRVSLLLAPAVASQEQLVVPLLPAPRIVSQDARRDAEPAPTASVPPPEVPRRVIRNHTRSLRPSTSFIHHLVAAAVEALGGVR